MMFQVQEYRELDFATIQHRNDLTSLALDFHNRHCVGIFVYTYRDFVLVAAGKIIFKLAIGDITSLRNTDDYEVHPISGNFVPVNLALVSGNVYPLELCLCHRLTS